MTDNNNNNRKRFEDKNPYHSTLPKDPESARNRVIQKSNDMFKEIAKCVSDIIYNDEDVLLRDITAIVKQRSDHISPIQSEEYTDEGTEDAYATYIAVYQLLLSFELTLDYGGLATQSNLTDLKKDGTEQFEKLLKDIRDKIDYKHML